MELLQKKFETGTQVINTYNGTEPNQRFRDKSNLILTHPREVEKLVITDFSVSNHKASN